MLDTNTWQGVREEVLRRIMAREWKPGDPIPKEMDLAEELGCARTTVNRALRDLADDGILERKRKSGPRVALHPTGRAVLEIPIIRKEVEARGQRYSYSLVTREVVTSGAGVALALELPASGDLLHLVAMHIADGAPFVLEDRWINLDVVPRASTADFTRLSANEWLLEHVPYTRSDVSISATSCGAEEAGLLGVEPGTALLAMERTTWNDEEAITAVRLLHMPSYRFRTTISN